MSDSNPVSTPPGIADRAKAIILRPRDEWPLIEAEPASIGSIYTGYAMILAAIPPLATLIGGQVFGHGLFGITWRPPLIGAIGTLRFRTFFERVHAPTLGTSWGTGAIVLASMLMFSVLGSRLVLHEILIGIFVTITTPVTLMLLARAALYRESSEGGEPEVPADQPTD